MKIPSVPRISIVTPSYNQAQFLEETILSVLCQNYPDLEHIVIDGGSTDGSVEIIRKYEKHLAYWVSEKDEGQPDAINKGFSRCTGDILNWINSDDRLRPNALNALAEAARAHPKAGAWVGACDLVDEKGKLIDTIVPYGLVRDKLAGWSTTGYFFQPACFFSMDVWEKCGPLDNSLYIAFDLDFFLKIAGQYEFYRTDECWAEATIHARAKTSARVPLMRAETCVVQVRHGYENIAIRRIEMVERLAGEAKNYPTAVNLAVFCSRMVGRLKVKKFEKRVGDLLRKLGLHGIVRLYRKIFYPHVPGDLQ